MRRRRLLLAAGALAALAAGIALGAGGGDEPGTTPQSAATPAPTAASTPRPEPVDRLSLAQQVGRMVILRFAGTAAPGYVTEALRRRRVAGVILFGDNVVDQAQTQALTATVREASSDLEPLICVDQEGGEVRILPWAPPERSAPEQQASGLVREDAVAAGHALDAAGVNVTLAPVADVPSAGSVLAGRAFTSDPDAAAAAIGEAVAGWHEGGVATTVKHFPGLGGATVNTDDGPATIDRTRAELRDDLTPFETAVGAGTEFVMVSHATYPALDGEYIASQSPAIVDGLLRDELGYDGVVMTDSLEAAAVQAVADVEEAAVASAQAGVDVILTTGRGSYTRVFRALLARARQDANFRERVRTAAARVLAAQSSRDG
ncbi:MAG TPA: glycoside hydrolase family 3 N-terminal domain-containing protein [Solirubrobacteraceae bacterium]|nr:glycoside hydrolase family 3 N-terminal domain-containing protein [Solirubrobacteraceae bacterium]